jgi:hypothetical protein
MSEEDENRPEKPVTNEKAMPGAQNPFDRLPFELRHCILASLSDIPSLISAALSCRALYATLREGENIIAGHVLINSLGPSVLPEAVVTHRCSPPFCSVNVASATEFSSDEQVKVLKNYVSNFLGHLERPVLSSTRWSMQDAVALDDYHHRVILKLAQRFIQACGRASSFRLEIGNSLQSHPPSISEQARIVRSLYRFETFRRLFGCLGNMDNEILHLVIVFFSKFAPWENAQLACIHDFLAWQVRPGAYSLHSAML